MELFARSPKKSLPFALAIGYWRWEGKKDPYIYKVYRGARKSASFFVFSTFIKIAVSFTVLIPCLVFTERTPREHRRNSNSTPRLQKVLFLKMGSNKVVPIPKKSPQNAIFVCMSVKK